MVSRITVRCPGCDELITLRLSVGPSEIQPFYYVCRKCKAATRGRLIAKFPDLKLELEAGEEIGGIHDTDQIITIDTSLPTYIDAKHMGEPGGSPFIFHTMIFGPEQISNLIKRTNQFRHLIKNDWLDLKRLFRYYIDRNWTMFDKGIGQYIPKESLSKAWHRHDAMHRLLDIFTVHIWAKDTYPKMKKEWNEFFIPKGQYKDLIISFSQKIEKDAEIIHLQEHLFDCLVTYVQEHDAILPGFIAESYPKPLEQYGDLRILRDDFPVLRDIYVQTFETCHKAIPIIVEMVNVVKRGAPEKYTVPKGIKSKPNKRTQFQKYTSSDKTKYLFELPVWNDAWSLCLDRSLRNHIGHREIRHDLQSGSLTSSKNKAIPYIEFLAKTHRLLYPILAILNAIKIPLIYADMLNE